MSLCGFYPMGNEWREVGVLLVTAGQKQEPLAFCSNNEKGFFLSWLRVSKQADTTEPIWCGALVNQPEQKSEVGREPMPALLSWTEVHWKDAEHTCVSWAVPLGR